MANQQRICRLLINTISQNCRSWRKSVEKQKHCKIRRSQNDNQNRNKLKIMNIPLPSIEFELAAKQAKGPE